MSIMAMIVVLLSGFLFSLGLAIAGMTNPQNVLDFLDITGNWNWRLLLVMCGGIAVSAVAIVIVRGMKKPWCNNSFQLPIGKMIDSKLLGGAVIFGMGWGLAGYCPGPAIASLASAHWQPIVFVVAMLVGMFATIIS